MKTRLSILFFAFAFCAACGGPSPLNAGNGGGAIVAFGDSITAGHGVQYGEDYPSLLGRQTMRQVINLGVSGDTAANGNARKYEIADYSPYMVLIEFGGNDAMRALPLSQTERNLSEVIDYVQQLGAVAVVVDTGGIFRMAPYSKMMRRLAKEKRALFVPAIMKDIFTDPALKSDAIHPNAKGHQIIAERILKVIEPYL